jgi:hypothetical protein
LFPKPVPIDATNPPYVALLVARGRVWWSFAKLPDPEAASVVEGSAADIDQPAGKVTLRVGAPTGPWRDLPALFASGGDAFQLLGGNLRVIGHAPHGAPLAPLAITMGTAKGASAVPATPVAVTPTVKGAPVVVASALDVSSDQQVLLNILSYIGGTITLKNLQVVLHTRDDAPPSGLTTRG